nr:Chain A, Superoxide dismutase [Cu-Zn] [Homo sapiens]5WMJ_B Chain B, Superoxide dismutase [Cu-Zn] [Homo sapiens]
KVWGSI